MLRCYALQSTGTGSPGLRRPLPNILDRRNKTVTEKTGAQQACPRLSAQLAARTTTSATTSVALRASSSSNIGTVASAPIASTLNSYSSVSGSTAGADIVTVDKDAATSSTGRISSVMSLQTNQVTTIPDHAAVINPAMVLPVVTPGSQAACVPGEMYQINRGDGVIIEAMWDGTNFVPFTIQRTLVAGISFVERCVSSVMCGIHSIFIAVYSIAKLKNC